MKRTRRDLILVLLSAVAALGSAPPTMAGTWETRMTQGKLAADLGDGGSAEQLFAGLATDTTAPEPLRAEALVRLGVVQRATGNAQASAATFRRAMQSPGRDAQVTRLLTLAVAGVAPDRKRWATQWPKVRLASQPGVGERHPFIVWPGPGPQGVREAFAAEDLVTFDLDDVPLVDFLHHLLAPRPTNDGGWRTAPGFETWPESYQPPAAIRRLGFVIHAGVAGLLESTQPRVTVKAPGLPWNELFENVLASNGLGFVIEKDVLFVARVEDLGAMDRVRGRTYVDPPISLNFLRGDLDDVIRLFSHVTGFGIARDANLQGALTLLVSERPALQVFDLFLVATDLAATRIDAPDEEPGATILRIHKLADVMGDAVDLSRLRPTPARRRPLLGFEESLPKPSARFAAIEGAVQVKKGTALRWIDAELSFQLNPGDLVRTGCGASAEIGFTNGAKMRMGADSLVVIEGEGGTGMSVANLPPPSRPCGPVPPTPR